MNLVHMYYNANERALNVVFKESYETQMYETDTKILFMNLPICWRVHGYYGFHWAKYIICEPDFYHRDLEGMNMLNVNLKATKC